ncbi:C40 family peptidase [Paenibacillus xerothermodurans]|uniref:C40 family peptidase n=1 Tax=Paenibacillus xerothermodurans TaxID=1977292 RepID=UPI001FB4B4ED|nr:NlpC/P60 family protein [Paenibacillus xerothermodurans]
MNRFYRKLYLSCAFFTAGLVGLSHTQDAQAASSEAKVQINDTLINFPDSQPFIDDNSSMQIPMRVLTEQLGFKVDWAMLDEHTVKVTITKGTQTIMVQTGDSTAQINGNAVKMDSPAQFLEGRVYLPLRFISEKLNYRIQWDANNRLAIIDADGQYHAPAWYKPQPQPQLQSQAKPSVIQNAHKFLGVPYKYGGSTPSGFDCSGYVNHVFAMNGIDLPRTTAAMYDHAGTRVTDLQEGDLVFFADGKKASHVGIYIGNQKFIHAANKYGVSVSSLTTGYWGQRYVGAKRVTA